MKLKFFSLAEFDSPDLPGSGESMKPDFLKKLDKAREIAGVPFTINSGFATVAHNKKRGGAKNSAHLRGHAADISTPDSVTRLKVVSALLEVGFTRVGIGRTFVHADDDPTLPQDVMWHYY